MQQTVQTKTPLLKFMLILAAATSVMLVFTLTPWNIVPTLVTEDVSVITVTDYGCVGNCSAQAEADGIENAAVDEQHRPDIF